MAGLGLELESRAMLGSHLPGRDFILPRPRRARCLGENKPRDTKMNGDMVRMKSNRVYGPAATASLLTLMGGVGKHVNCVN